MSDTNQPRSSHEPMELPRRSVRSRRGQTRTGEVHLLFGAVEDLLADLVEEGAPDGNVVRVERLVRRRAHELGGAATLGIAVTARREREVLSCWVVIARLGLDPWGSPIDRSEAQVMAERHREAQRLIGALVADAGFDVRLGLYLLPDAAYAFAATCATLASPSAISITESGDQTQGGKHHA